MEQYREKLFEPSKLWLRDAILNQKPCPIPAEWGVCAWYFKKMPAPVKGQVVYQYNGFSLLYVRIAPSRPTSSTNLRKRIKQHLRGNASGSTLRLSLGCLLAEELGIELRRVGNGRRMTFGAGEETLSNWLQQNAYVTWAVHIEPWVLEEELINQLSLPLNLDGNKKHPFYKQLSTTRKEAKQRARRLPVTL